MTAWNENEKFLKNWLIKETGNHDQALDLLQDLFVKSLQNKERFCTLTDAKSWLFRVAKNSLIDSYRKSKLEISADCYETDGIEDVKEDNKNTTIIKLQHCLVRVLSELDDDDKEVIELCDMKGMPQADYAHTKGLSLSATKSRIQRARKKLRQQMISSCNVQFEQQKVCCFTPRK